MTRLHRNRDIVVLLLLFVGLGLAYSIINPLHEATDELRHYRFVRYIVVNKSLPVQGQEACRFQSHHPPLFYALGAVASGWVDAGEDLCRTPPANRFWAYRFAEVGVDNKNQYLHGPEEAFPWRGEALAAHLIRALNVLIGAGAVWATWATGRAIWPRRRALALGGAAFVAFNPMFLYMAGAINNDILAAFSGSAILLASVRLLRDPQGLSRRWGLLFGLLYGIALLSKFNMAAAGLLIAVAATYVAWRRRQWRRWPEVGLLSLAVAALLAGWWFVRNQMLYGEPTGFRTVTELWGARDPLQSLPLAIFELPAAWSTLWGRFGFGQIPLPQVLYDALAWIVLLGLAGALISVARRRRDTATIFLGLLFLNVVLSFAVLFNYMLVSPAGAMGRFFFPGLPALSLLTFYGLSRLAAGLKTVAGVDSDRLLAWLANGAMLALSLVALLGYLAPAYARPPAFPADAEPPNAVDASFAGLATLRGYELDARSLEPGQPLEVSLYWEVEKQPPGDFLLFLHLIDEAGTVVAQRDTHPGTGAFPTSHWQPGQRFVDTLSVYVPETAYTPETATVYVGLYAPTYRLAISGPQGEDWGDALALGEVALEPAAQQGPERALPNPTAQNFEDEWLLRGYEYNARVLAPGDVFRVTLYWTAADHATTQSERHPVVELQLLDDAGIVRGSMEHPLPDEAVSASAPTPSVHDLSLGRDLPAGAYRVRLVLHDEPGGKRLHILAPEGHFAAQHLDLARIRIEP
ncbi:MAG TPA: DUF2142 domain-containing protein [Candidatus Sulfomarinibacteraceae bacterium]|nr:DUF2142 domain-containing protein [Candidatus Sulfomarinibacteraceae bacterium]